VYGSASAGFSLKNSDIDLVLLTDSNNVTLRSAAMVHLIKIYTSPSPNNNSQA
jgi:DNA polymerase sigma